MKNRILIIILWISTITFISITIIPYYLKFGNNEISNNPEKWAQFGDYFGGFLNPLISILNLIVLTYLSIRLVKDEDERNKWTLQELARPYAELSFNKTPNSIEVLVQNIGLGPMIITEIIIKNSENTFFSDFSKIVKPITQTFRVEISAFSVSNNHCAIGKDSEIVLLKMEGNKDELLYLQFMKLSIEKLKDYTIEIHYTDMYKRKMDLISEKITFGFF